MALNVTSRAYAEGAPIPAQYTCQGENASPPLTWSAPPGGTQSFVLIMEDPDASRLWDHWIVYNLPGSLTGLPPGIKTDADLPGGALHGKNTSGRSEYAGPCPPGGPAHRYFIRVYALDGMLDLPGGASKADVQAAMQGHVLAEGELMGRYQKQ